MRNVIIMFDIGMSGTETTSVIICHTEHCKTRQVVKCNSVSILFVFVFFKILILFSHAGYLANHVRATTVGPDDLQDKWCMAIQGRKDNAKYM